VESLAIIVSDITGAADAVVVDDLDTLFRAHYGRLVRALSLVAGSQ